MDSTTDTKPEPYWCGWHKWIYEAWVEYSVGMCQACFDKCRSCGGTGLIAFHPRLGLSTYCGCKYGREMKEKA